MRGDIVVRSDKYERTSEMRGFSLRSKAKGWPIPPRQHVRKARMDKNTVATRCSEYDSLCHLSRSEGFKSEEMRKNAATRHVKDQDARDLL